MSYARNWIGGSWEEPGASAIETVDPATGERIGKAPKSTAADVERAVAAAKAALPGVVVATPRRAAPRS